VAFVCSSKELWNKSLFFHIVLNSTLLYRQSIPCYYNLTFWLTDWVNWLSWAILEKPPVAQLLKNFPLHCETWRFITVFTRALHWALSSARWIHFLSSYPVSPRSILMLVSYLHLGHSSGLFHSVSYMHTYLPIRATCPAILILLGLIILILLGEQYKSRSSSLCSFLHHPVTSSHFGPNAEILRAFWNKSQIKLGRARRKTETLILTELLLPSNPDTRLRMLEPPPPSPLSPPPPLDPCGAANNIVTCHAYSVSVGVLTAPNGTSGLSYSVKNGVFWGMTACSLGFRGNMLLPFS
jgi:hypothetical protein